MQSIRGHMQPHLSNKYLDLSEEPQDRGCTSLLKKLFKERYVKRLQHRQTNGEYKDALDEHYRKLYDSSCLSHVLEDPVSQNHAASLILNYGVAQENTEHMFSKEEASPIPACPGDGKFPAHVPEYRFDGLFPGSDFLEVFNSRSGIGHEPSKSSVVVPFTNKRKKGHTLSKAEELLKLHNSKSKHLGTSQNETNRPLKHLKVTDRVENDSNSTHVNITSNREGELDNTHNIKLEAAKGGDMWEAHNLNQDQVSYSWDEIFGTDKGQSELVNANCEQTLPETIERERGKPNNIQHSIALNFQKLLLELEVDAEESDPETFDVDDLDEDDDVAKEREEMIINRETRAYSFFAQCFVDNNELRKLYEEQCNCGSFFCLVCVASGPGSSKVFPDLTSLVQHSKSILKTKRRAEHRGYNRAITNLLGWGCGRPLSASKNVAATSRVCIPIAEEVPVEETS